MARAESRSKGTWGRSPVCACPPVHRLGLFVQEIGPWGTDAPAPPSGRLCSPASNQRVCPGCLEPRCRDGPGCPHAGGPRIRVRVNSGRAAGGGRRERSLRKHRLDTDHTHRPGSGSLVTFQTLDLYGFFLLRVIRIKSQNV